MIRYTKNYQKTIICDICKEPIKRVDEGIVIFHEDVDEDVEGDKFQIVHKNDATYNDEGELLPGCDPGRETYDCWEPLEWFLSGLCAAVEYDEYEVEAVCLK